MHEHLAALNASDPARRRRAAEALARDAAMLSDEARSQAVEALLAVLGDGYSDVRAAAVSALGALGMMAPDDLRQRMLRRLVTALDDADASVRVNAARALAAVGDAAVLEPLLVALDDFDAIVRREVVAALEALLARPEQAALRRDALRMMAAALHDEPDRLVRYYAQRACSRLEENPAHSE